MGSSRVTPASTPVTPLQTHTPSGSSSPPMPVLDMSSSIKSESSTHLDVAMNPESWEESYQDLSSWCNATSAGSPAICQTLAIDETVTNGIEFHGEIDFDLRKSEEIASIPLDEDSSFNWGVGIPVFRDNSPPTQSVSAVPSTKESNPVLLKDCWWSEIEQGKVVKELESSRPLTAIAPSLSKDHFNPNPGAVLKEEVADTKENMNPIVVQQPQQPLQLFLSDPIKMAELQSRLEKIARITQPGVNSRAKAAELMKILQEQVAALNKKKCRSAAAISDLHNNHASVRVEPQVPSTTIEEAHPLGVVSYAPVRANAADMFQSDPFEGLFPVPEVRSPQVPYLSGSECVPPQMFSQNTIAAPAFVPTTFQPNAPKSLLGNDALQGTDLFIEAHHEIMREAPKPQPFQAQPQVPVSDQQMFHSSNQNSTPMPNFFQPLATIKGDSGMTVQKPPLRLNLPELDALNFDALLFGSPGTLGGVNKVPAMSTPEVLKPLVDTPDLETFDLLSYLCDDKVSTPPVGLDTNPFRFSLSSASTTSTTSSTITAAEHKSNVMVVKPMTHVWSQEEKKPLVLEAEEDTSVVVEVKPQLRPSVLSVVEEEDQVESSGAPSDVPEPIKEEQVSPRPCRKSRKRKYSEDEFELSLSPSEEYSRSSRQRRASSKYDSDEEFTLPVRKSRKKSITSIIEEDDEEEVRPKRLRAASTVKRGERTVSTSSESDRYRELRDRNNEASRKSRLTRKAREQELGKQAEVLTRENRILKVKVDEMENLVKKLREALLQSMIKKS